ncbi:MAG: dockerin type I repeat-containing protein, partial [Clostridia bacterium]|nr:dockerin type I repeat-containing protein [Clostridia bacterium]
LSAPVIVLENESEAGAVFSTSISPSVLFDHRGNLFTLQAGGTFVDYDGDGMNDDVDPEPTVNKNCAEGKHFGDVNSDDAINTLDLTVLRQYLADSSTVLSSGADVNGDDGIDTLDLTLLRQYLADPTTVLGASAA